MTRTITENEKKQAFIEIEKAENLAFKCRQAAIVLYTNGLIEKDQIGLTSSVLQRDSWRWNKN